MKNPRRVAFASAGIACFIAAGVLYYLGRHTYRIFLIGEGVFTLGFVCLGLQYLVNPKARWLGWLVIGMSAILAAMLLRSALRV